MLVAAGLLSAGCASPDEAAARNAQAKSSPAASRIECRVSRISDGDSFVCGSAGRVRLLMIDAPELSQGDEGVQARQALERLAPKGTLIRIETDVRPKDDYDRILGYAWLTDGRLLNEEMARAGMVTALVYPPNVKHANRIRAAAREAQKSKRGLWSTNFFDCLPRDYRAGRCGIQPGRKRPNRQSRGSS